MNIAATTITTANNSAGRAVPATPTRSSPTSGQNPSNTGRTSEVPGTTTAETARKPQDTIELSAKGRRLAQTIAEDVAAEDVAKAQATAAKPEPKDIAEPELDALPGKEPLWESERRSKLERLETLVRQGLYKVDPFMLDEIAVRMAKMLY